MSVSKFKTTQKVIDRIFEAAKEYPIAKISDGCIEICIPQRPYYTSDFKELKRPDEVIRLTIDGTVVTIDHVSFNPRKYLDAIGVPKNWSI